jgi:Kef-type K+ transport system membrane component KefB/predicted transcriptional regulator
VQFGTIPIDVINMTHTLVNASAEVFSPWLDLNLALLFGLVIFGGAFGARLFQKFHIPQVVGAVVVGILLGRDIFNLITPERVESLKPFTMFALGIIGFMIGAELRAEVFRKYGRQFFIILFSQGFGAFLLVALGTSLMAWLISGRLYSSIAMGLVLGAIASATAPASTVNVLWEYKTRGPLTAAILAIVALDDALALLLYRGAATGAKALLGTADGSVFGTTLILLAEIVGTVLLGFLAGVTLYLLLKFVRADDKILEFSIASLLLIVGVSIIAGIDPILPAMVLGITMANLAPRQSEHVFELIRKFSPPVYTSFFVLAGAHIELGRLASSTAAITAVYISLRVGGKVVGSWFGAKHSKAPAVVRKYLGICLLPQAGVAIGLAILSSQLFNSDFGKTVIMVVMTETFIIELLGPILVKVGLKRAGEVGLNITEDDLIRSYSVADVMDAEVPTISAGMSLSDVIKVVSNTNNFYYSVVDDNNKLMGAVTLDGIRNTFATQELNDWLVALDIAEPIIDKVTPDMSLSDALEKIRKLNVEHVPVVVSSQDNSFVGVLGDRAVRRSLSAEILSRRQKADSIASM